MTSQTTMPNAEGVRPATAAPCKDFVRAALLLLAAGLTVLAGCSGPIFGQKQARRDVYMNLMIPVQQAHFRYMEATERPASLKLAYLQEIGVYQQWAEQPKDIQVAILRCDVVEGMTPLQVQMAWGLPDEKRDVTEPAERAGGHAKTVWEYRIRIQKSGGGSYERSVCFLDDRVLWVRLAR